MNGSANISVTKIARIFGTNTRVCSWICVSAWNSDTTTPTTRPTTIIGDATTTMVQIASRATSRVSAPVIFCLACVHLFRHAGGMQASNPESRDSPMCDGCGLVLTQHPVMTAFSDRHLHDVFVGG